MLLNAWCQGHHQRAEEIEPGAMRELHWHPHADEWQCYLEGVAEMAVYLGMGHATVRATTFFAVPFQDSTNFPASSWCGHLVQST
jgi:oxalate decarboxylase/phosphoglucose isomerase-like protein (cupin superfamily)